MSDNQDRISYIKEIPDGWLKTKGKYIFLYIQKPVLDSDRVVTCFRDGKVTLRANRREEGFTVSEKEIGYQGIDVGDLVVHGMDGFAGAIGISDSRGKASPVLNVLETKQSKKYYMYFMRNMAAEGVFIALATGIRVRTCDTNWGKLRDIYYLVPPLSEQKAIADYLDDKCGQIDEIAKIIEGQIATLEQYKRSIITEKVTKGLDSSVPMKDSGIEWIGAIPEHWNVIKGKYLFNNNKQIVGAKVDEFERLALTMKGVIKRSKDDNEGLQPDKFNTYQILRESELVFKLIDLQNVSTSRVGLSPYVGIVSPAYIIIKSKGDINPNYAEKYYLSLWRNQIFNFLGDAGVRSSLNAGELLNLYLPVPPLSEQKAIADYLDDKCGQIDEIINGKKKQLETLQSYKQSIIYEYVTGKREVPHE